MQRLAVSGWHEDSARFVALLERHAALTPVAVGDHRGSALVQARSETDLPCFQHLLEMLRVTEFDALLIDGVPHGAQLAEAAAARGADLILRGDATDPATLEAASQAAGRHGVALAVLRPRLRVAGLAFVTGQLGSAPEWRPWLVSVEISGDRSPIGMLRDAVAAHLRLLPQPPSALAASQAGPADEPLAIAVQLRLPGGATAALLARHGSRSELRILARAAAGSLELVAVEGGSTLTVTPDAGPQESSLLRHGELLELEATRIAGVRAGDAVDALLAPREAAVLAAVERAIAGDELAQPLAVSLERPALRVLPGGGHASAVRPRETHLTLVTG